MEFHTIWGEMIFAFFATNTILDINAFLPLNWIIKFFAKLCSGDYFRAKQKELILLSGLILSIVAI